MNIKPGTNHHYSPHSGSPEQAMPLLSAAGKPLDKAALKTFLMDSLEVQALLKICRTTLYNWRRKNLIPFSKIGSRVYFEVSDVYQMLKLRKQPIRQQRA